MTNKVVRLKWLLTRQVKNKMFQKPMADGAFQEATVDAHMVSRPLERSYRDRCFYYL